MTESSSNLKPTTLLGRVYRSLFGVKKTKAQSVDTTNQLSKSDFKIFGIGFNVFGKRLQKLSESPPQYRPAESYFEEYSSKGKKITIEKAQELSDKNTKSIQSWMNNSPAAKEQTARNAARNKAELMESSFSKSSSQSSQKEFSPGNFVKKEHFIGIGG